MNAKKIYLNVFESDAEKAELIIERLRRMDSDTQARSVKRAGREIEKVLDSTSNRESDILVRLCDFLLLSSPNIDIIATVTRRNRNVQSTYYTCL